MTCVGCERKYKISDYDGKYEEIGEKEIVNFMENNVPVKEMKTVSATTVKDASDTDMDYLPPPFDLTDAPILDFATPLVSDDPSSLISKVGSSYMQLPLTLFVTVWHVFYADQNHSLRDILRKAYFKTVQKLIKGWALLDAVCDSSVCKGNTPLMRDREEQVCSSSGRQSMR